MQAWAGSFGKPLLCLIEADRKVAAYYIDNQTEAAMVTACELLPRGIVIAFDQGDSGHDQQNRSWGNLSRCRIGGQAGWATGHDFGAGALGSHLDDNLARQGFRKLGIIDRNRVEEHNIRTQIFGAADVGSWKVEVIRSRRFRAVEIEIDAVGKELSERNARSLLKGSNIVIDTFDNSASRQQVQQQCRDANIHCLHVGLYAD